MVVHLAEKMALLTLAKFMASEVQCAPTRLNSGESRTEGLAQRWMACDVVLQARAAAYCTLTMVSRGVLTIAKVRDVSISRHIASVVGSGLSYAA